MPWTGLLLAALAANLILQFWLDARQVRHVRAVEPGKAKDYALARLAFARWPRLAHATLLLAWTLGGGISMLAALWGGSGGGSGGGEGPARGVGLLLSAFAAQGLVMLPFAAWFTFRIEARFGFNRTTRKLFAIDLAKSALLGGLLGGGLAYLVLWLMDRAGAAWWIYGWAAWIAFALLFSWIWPTWIAPLFNRFTPLPPGELADRLEALVESTGFDFAGVFLMDGSRRSAHSNAYFTGWGRRKRVVLFDTLVDQLTPEELEAVLAHELGHFKLRHIGKGLAISAALGLAGFALLGWLAGRPDFQTGLGVESPSTAAGLLLFLWVGPLPGFVLRPAWSALTKRFEYEADAFAAGKTAPQPMIDALLRLSEANASPLTRDKIYSAFHDSHPPPSLRVARLQAML